MKRFLSMALALALVLTTLVIPASAADAATSVVVDITSISDGDIFSKGANIGLAATASNAAESQVKNIDFYANGAKLPGTIVGASGTIVWYAPSEGVYDVTTKITYVDNAVADGGETVRVVVLPANTDKIVPLWPDGEGLTVTSSSETFTYELSDDYAIFGTKSLKIVPKADNVGVTFERTPEIPLTWNRMAILVYVPETIDGLVVSNGGNSGQKMTDASIRRIDPKDSTHYINKGLNRFVTETGTYGTTTKLLDYAKFTFGGATEDNTNPVYILGFVGMTDALYGKTGTACTAVTPVPAPEIADKTEGVCNKVGTYRINFNTPIYADETKAPAIIKADGAVVDGVTYTYGTDYVDLHLPELELGKEYTVEIPEQTILSYYSAHFDGATQDYNGDGSADYLMNYAEASTFTFSTKDTDCLNATPIIKMSYPADGAKVPADTGFAAKLVSGSSALTGVEFYKGDTKLEGEVKEVTDENGNVVEYWLQPETQLTAGEAATITVKALGVEDVSASATYTAGSAPSYFVKGIYEGAVIVQNEEPSRRIVVVDEANKKGTQGSRTYTIDETPTDVAKVEFRNNGVLLDSTGNVCNLVFDKYQDNILEVKVTDIYGTVHPFTFNYKVKYGKLNTTESVPLVDFETEGLTAGDALAMISENNDGNFTPTLGSDATYTASNALILTPGTSAASYLQFKGAATTTGHKVHYYEFDLTTRGQDSRAVELTRLGYNQGGANANGVQRLLANKDLANGNSYFNTVKVRLVLDFNYEKNTTVPAPTALIYFDGKVYDTQSMSKLIAAGTQDPVLRLYMQNKTHKVYIDNFKYSVYDVNDKFGMNNYNNELIFENTGTEESPKYTGKKTLRTYATNASQEAVTVRNVIAVYENDGRLKFIYDGGTHNMTTPISITYAPGVINQETVYTWDMGDPRGRSARIFTFYSLNDTANNKALVPVGKFAE